MRSNNNNSVIKAIRNGRWTATFVGLGAALGVAIDLASGMVLIGFCLSVVYGLWLGAGIDAAIAEGSHQTHNNFHAIA